jgi:hypothetical protein
MLDVFLENICKEMQKPKIQKTLKHDLVSPLLIYILDMFAPYFLILFVLLIIIVILLIILVTRPYGFQISRSST